jgi:hypothetical protein
MKSPRSNFSLLRRAIRLFFAGSLMLSFGTGRSEASSGTEGAAFLDIPVGAGPAALGSAYTALAEDAYAPTWNSAGLGFVEGTELAGQHLSYLESIHYEYLSVVHPLAGSREAGANHKGLGFSAQYLASGDIPETDVNGNSIGDFQSHYGAYNLAYGQTLGEKAAIGVTGKWINAKIDDVSANAYAVDFGSMYKMTNRLTLAATVLNIGTKLKFLSEGDDLPLAFRAGAAFRLTKQVTLSSEGVYRKTGLGSVHFGGAWRPLDAISLRVGYRTDTLKGLSPLAGFSTGIGIHLWGQEISYAWVPYGELGNTQYFSALLHFGQRDEEKRNLIQYQTIKKHRTVKSGRERGTDEVITQPEYEQLMQLLSDDDSHLARSGSSRSSSER